MSEIHDMFPVEVDEYTTAGVTYLQYVDKGLATNPNEANSSILKIDETVANKTLFLWANGNKLFNNVWANRASLTYLPLMK
jgi:hypothetical protein